MKAERLLEIAFAMRDAQRDFYAERNATKFKKMEKLQREFDTARWEFKGYDECSSA